MVFLLLQTSYKSIMRGRLLVGSRSLSMCLLLIYTFSLIFWDYLIESKIAAGLLIIGSLIILKGRFRFKGVPYIWTYAFFILFFVLHTSLGFSRDSAASWNALSTMGLNLIISISFISLMGRDRKFLENYMKGYIVCVFLVCCYNLVIKHTDLFNGQLTINCPKLFSSEVYSHNDVPGYAVIALFFLVYFVGAKLISIRIAVCEIIFFVMFILLSGARKALIGALIAVLIYPYIYMNKKISMGKKLLRVGAVILLLAIIYLVIIKNGFLYNLIGYKFEDVFKGLVSGEFEESSAISRNRMIVGGIALIKQKPFIGYGLRAWSSWISLTGSWAHNMIIELTFSGGIFAPIIYYLFYIPFFKGLKKVLNHDYLSSMLLCYMLYMVVHDLLSVSYLARPVSLMYCVITVYLSNNYEIVNSENTVHYNSTAMVYKTLGGKIQWRANNYQ